MSGNSDKDIVKGCLDPKNWGCGKDAFTVLLVAVAVGTSALVVAGHAAMGLL